MINHLLGGVSHMILHGIVALPFVFFLYYKTKSLKYCVIPLIVVYLIDMDHLVDYITYYGFDINLTKFISSEYFSVTNRAIVPLHAWEWFLVVTALSLKNKKWKSVYTGVAFGILAHLLWDSYNVGSVIFYSILYRVSNGFFIVVL